MLIPTYMQTPTVLCVNYKYKNRNSVGMLRNNENCHFKLNVYVYFTIFTACLQFQGTQCCNIKNIKIGPSMFLALGTSKYFGKNDNNKKNEKMNQRYQICAPKTNHRF